MCFLLELIGLHKSLKKVIHFLWWTFREALYDNKLSVIKASPSIINASVQSMGVSMTYWHVHQAKFLH